MGFYEDDRIRRKNRQFNTPSEVKEDKVDRTFNKRMELSAGSDTSCWEIVDSLKKQGFIVDVVPYGIKVTKNG